jgi:beta-glucosidase
MARLSVREVLAVSVVVLGCTPHGPPGDDSIVTNRSALTATYEAESMFHSTGGAITGGWNIWSNGYISTNHAFTNGTPPDNRITVRAQGQFGVGAWPHMVVSIAGVAIGNVTVGTATWQDYSFNFTPRSATQELRVEFDNDAVNGSDDRNLLVDRVVVDSGTAPTCSDGQKNGAETGVDCGGDVCPDCPNGQACVVNGDCLSGFCVSLVCSATPPPYLNPSLPVATRVADLLGRMTLAEKIGQMAQSEQQTSTPNDVKNLMLGSVLSGADSTLNPPDAAAWANLVNGYQTAALQTRLAIPIIYGIDAVHGNAKVLNGTVFPHNIGLGATRDPSLVQQAGAITAQELRATGVVWTFAPAASVARDQRWGRAYESFGEDPALVTSMMTAVTGLQGTSLAQVDAVLATAKHYVGDGGAMWGTGNNPENTPIDRGNAQMPDASIRAIHLAPYLNALSRGVGSVMASFSSVNGTKMHANTQWLTTVLKGELGFSGFVISDWQATDQLTGTFTDQIRTAVNAGVDMFMLPNSYASFISTMQGLVNNGVTIQRIDDAVSRILTKKFQLGLFEAPMANTSGAGQIGSAAHRNVARQAVRASLVLLKNTSSFLPLSPTTTVCVTGNGASNLPAQVGGWTLGWQAPLTTVAGATTILQGVTSVVGAANVVSSGCQVGIRVVAESATTAMRQSYAEWRGDDDDPDHDGSGTCTATNGCVVVLLGGRPMDIQPFVADANTKAIVMAWYPGSEGLGVAEVLYGVGGANFTGKLPVTWKVDATDTPVNYCDGALPDTCGDTGGHYSNTASPPSTVLFPYGFGLSYGTGGPTCTDGIRNGSETDIDCGGSCPNDCADGKLCGVNGDCTGNNCVSGTCCTVLAAPAGTPGATPGNGQVTLSWNTVSSAERYNVKRSTTSGSGHATVGTPTAPPHTDPGLTNGTTYFYVVSSVNVCGAVSAESANSAQVSATPSGGGGSLPAPWLTQDIGAVATAGSASFTSPTFTVAGSGADITGTADEFRYVYQPLTGNATIVARVNSVGNTDPWAKGGVMIRESLTAGSRFALALVRPDRRVAYQFRTATGGAAAFGPSGTTPVGDTTNPKWVRLTRVGNTITAAFSTNGTTFTTVDSAQTITMTGTVFVGLAVTSHLDGTLSTATFDNVTATDMVAYYKFDEASGTSGADSSGNLRTATLSGATFTAAHIGNGVRIAGGTQFVDLPDGLVQSCADLTVAAWVRLTTNSTNWARIFDFGSSTSTYMFLSPRAGASNVLRFAGRLNGGTEQQISFTFAFPTNAWRHVAVTLTGNTGRLYLDGAQVAQNTSFTLDPSGMGNSLNNWLGRSQFTADPRLDGTLDDVRISCRAYSATEIAALAAM